MASYPATVVLHDTAPAPAMTAPPAAPVDSAAGGVSQTTTGKGSEPAPAKDAEDPEDDADESISLLEEIIDGCEVFDYTDAPPDHYTAEEARALRQRLHEVGASQFIMENLTLEKTTARKLCTAFGIRVPKFLADAPDEAFYQLLGLAINRELNKRPILQQYKTIDDAAKLLQERKNVMIITGAGISTSLGIPDFRSKNTGFYSRLLEMGYDEPEQVFDIHNFDENPRIFYSLAGDIVPDLDKWTPTHEFIRLLQDKDKLLTNYTQNIDNVEANAGIKKEKLIQCHGSWATATCRKCKYNVPGEEIFDSVKAQKPAECKRCIEELKAQKPSLKRKRSSNGTSSKKKRSSDEDSDSDGAYDIPQPGIMKPDITFFGEQLPNDFFDRLTEVDKEKVDLVIVMGTSMKVAPVSEIPNFLPREVPQIYISRDPIHHINFDINLIGDCDVVVAELARRAGWELRHKMIPEGQQVEIGIINEFDHVYSVKSRGPAQPVKAEIRHEAFDSVVNHEQPSVA